MIRKFGLALALASTLGACAADPASIQPAYVSPALYAGQSCEGLRAEAVRLNARIGQVTGQQQQAANSDAGMMTIGMLIFWPAIFAVGSGDQSAELAQLRGEAEALQEAARQRGC